MKLETARLLTYRAAWLEQNGKPSGVAATTAKCLTSEWAVESTDFGIQVLGGYGYAEEVAAAFVELGPGASLTEAEVIGHCLEQMATFKVPRYVRFVSEWPMSGTKIQKARLRQRIADELAGASVTAAPRLSRA